MKIESFDRKGLLKLKFSENMFDEESGFELADLNEENMDI